MVLRIRRTAVAYLRAAHAQPRPEGNLHCHSKILERMAPPTNLASAAHSEPECRTSRIPLPARPTGLLETRVVSCAAVHGWLGVIAFQSSPILSLPRARSRVLAAAVPMAATCYLKIAQACWTSRNVRSPPQKFLPCT